MPFDDPDISTFDVCLSCASGVASRASTAAPASPDLRAVQQAFRTSVP